MSTVVTRVFMNGDSQAVRIPQEFRLLSSRVEISRNDDGDLIIHPVRSDRGTAFAAGAPGRTAASASTMPRRPAA